MRPVLSLFGSVLVLATVLAFANYTDRVRSFSPDVALMIFVPASLVVLAIVLISLRAAISNPSDYRRAYAPLIAGSMFIGIVTQLSFAVETGIPHIWVIFTGACVGPLVTLLVVRMGISGASRVEQQTVASAVESVIKSDRFLSILNSTLPSGGEDHTHGFDYVPFMLSACDQRLQQSLRSARRFLWLTVALGLIFATTLTFFVYILINEAAAGLPRTLVDLERHTGELHDDVRWVAPLEASESFSEVRARAIEPLMAICEKACADVSILRDAVKKTTETSDLSILRKALDGILPLSGAPPKDAEELRTSVARAQDEISKFDDYRTRRKAQLADMVSAQETLVHDVKAKLGEGSDHVAEILKRLGLGFVLASFFIAILRYLVGLYREHYEQSLLAYQDEQLIRRFYVAYRCSEQNADARAASVNLLLRGVQAMPGTNVKTASEAEDKAGADAQVLLKQIIEALTKKLGG